MVLVQERTAFGSRTTLFFIFIIAIFLWFSKLQIKEYIYRNIRCANTLVLNIQQHAYHTDAFDLCAVSNAR